MGCEAKLATASGSEVEEVHRSRRLSVMGMSRFRSLSMLVALVGIFSISPSHAGRADKMLRLRGGSPTAMASVASGVVAPLNKVANAIGQSLHLPGYAKKDSDADMLMGPTTGPTLNKLSQPDTDCSIGLPAHYKQFVVPEGPLADTMHQIATHERTLLVQASRCRAALVRLATLQKIMAARELDVKEAKEVERWKVSTLTLQRQLKLYSSSAGKELSDLLGEKTLAAAAQSGEMGDSAVTPDHHSEDDDQIASAKHKSISAPPAADGPTIRTKDGSLASKASLSSTAVTPSPPAELKELKTHELKGKEGAYGQQPTLGPYAPATWSGAAGPKQRPSISPPKTVVGKALFAQALEQKYRVATYEGIPVYGAVKNEDGSVFTYLPETEVHLVWDVDQSKLVGEGTNDVELVIKCVLWWKEEMSHDPNFVPSAVPNDIRKEFQAYCDSFDIEKALESVISLLVRPGAKEFVDKHPDAKWWTFTNKDREVDGQVVRDVSDDDGQVGMFQANPHEISGKPVVDANKYALQVLDRTACKHLGIQNQERPLIGVRGQRKDMGRVAKLIRKKREREGIVPIDRPVTIVLIDDRKCDAWGNCQANDERFLCHIPAHNALSEEDAVKLVSAMEKILIQVVYINNLTTFGSALAAMRDAKQPCTTLRKFYCAFRDADPTHALIQCVDIMSDDQSMLLKRHGGDNSKSTKFTYTPKTCDKSQLPPPLPEFCAHTEMRFPSSNYPDSKPRFPSSA